MEQPDVGELWHHMEELQNEVVNVETFDVDQNLNQPVWIHQQPCNFLPAKELLTLGSHEM